MRFCIFTLLVLFIFTCKSPEKTQSTSIQLSEHQSVQFLDSASASVAIITDTMEHFFDKINKLDMSIQLKKNINSSEPKIILLREYQYTLQTDVMNFSVEDMIFIKSIFQDIYDDCNLLSASIFPKEINLIKIRGTHYGDGAFYTRQNCIIIPASELENPDESSFRKTMLHELFHVYSRLNPEKKEALYKMIGFKSTGGTSLLQMDSTLKERIILNPDGINYAYAIQLKDGTKNFDAIPLIISNAESFQSDKNAFFSYLEFGLYKIVPPFSKMIKVVSGENGRSLIDYKRHPEFFSQITDNTEYIIHPDELMADNFVIVVNSLKNPSVLDKLSPEGKELIKKIKATLSE